MLIKTFAMVTLIVTGFRSKLNKKLDNLSVSTSVFAVSPNESAF
jgi:hypothetical protein